MPGESRADESSSQTSDPTGALERSGAFVERFEIEPMGSGPLDGLRFAVKDLIDVAGRVAGCGNPTWRDTHPPAAANAVCVDQLLGAGGRCAGKTVTDELAFGLDGENHWYGTPLNPRAPDRVPGGSSSGSASAVAGGFVDFALGTDTGGSVRVPAANCGILGFRPSHGRVSVAGVMPFAPTYDTVGMLASDAAVMDAASRILLGCAPRQPARVDVLHLVDDAFTGADEDVRDALARPIASLRERYGDRVGTTSLHDISRGSVEHGFQPWYNAFHQLQWAEIWSALGGWIQQAGPDLGPRVRNNFELVRGLDRSVLPGTIKRREYLFRMLHEFLGPHDLLCMPTAPALAPRKGSLPLDRRAGSYYPRTVSFTAIAGVGRLPQISLPLAEFNGVPVGLSLLARHGEDAFLLDVATEMMEADRPVPGNST